MLRERGVARVLGVDRDPEMVEETRARGHDARVLDARTGLAAIGERFDGVHLSFVIETMDGEEGIAALRACAALLKPDGLLVVRTLNPRNAAVRDGSVLVRAVGEAPVAARDAARRADRPGPAHRRRGKRARRLAARVRPRPRAGRAGRTTATRRGRVPGRVLRVQLDGDREPRARARAARASATSRRSIVPDEPAPEPSVAADPRFAALRETMRRGVPPCDVLIRQSNGAADFRRVDGARAMVQILPWEYGTLPRAWVEGLRAGGADEVWTPTEYCRAMFLERRDRARARRGRAERDRPGAVLAGSRGRAVSARDAQGVHVPVRRRRAAAQRRRRAARRVPARRSRATTTSRSCSSCSARARSTSSRTTVRACARSREDPHAPELVVIDEELGDDDVVRLYRTLRCARVPVPRRRLRPADARGARVRAAGDRDGGRRGRRVPRRRRRLPHSGAATRAAQRGDARRAARRRRLVARARRRRARRDDAPRRRAPDEARAKAQARRAARAHATGRGSARRRSRRSGCAGSSRAAPNAVDDERRVERPAHRANAASCSGRSAPRSRRCGSTGRSRCSARRVRSRCVHDDDFGGAAVHRYAGARPHNPRAVVEEAGAFVDAQRMRAASSRSASSSAIDLGKAVSDGRDVVLALVPTRARRRRDVARLRRRSKAIARPAGGCARPRRSSSTTPRCSRRCRRASSARSGSTPGRTRSRPRTRARSTRSAPPRRSKPAAGCPPLLERAAARATTRCTARCSKHAHLAGFALDTRSMGLHHAVCHVIGGLTLIPHGIVNAVVLPHAVRANARLAPDAVAAVAQAFGIADLAAQAETIAAAYALPRTFARAGRAGRSRRAGAAARDGAAAAREQSRAARRGHGRGAAAPRVRRLSYDRGGAVSSGLRCGRRRRRGTWSGTSAPCCWPCEDGCAR